MRAFLLLMLGCTGSSTTPPFTPTEPPPPPVTATGPVDLMQVVSEVHDVHRTILRVRWTQSRDATAHLEYSFDPGEWLSSPPRELQKGVQEELILGAPYDTQVTWRLVGEVKDEGQTTTPDVVTWTGRTPANLPQPTVVSADPDAWDPDMAYLLVSVSYDEEFFGEYAVTLVDRRGRVVWYHGTPRGFAGMHPRVSRTDRSFLIDHSSHWGGAIDGGETSRVLDMAIDGTVLKRWNMPGLYHSFTDLPDGSLAWPQHWSIDEDEEPGPDGERIAIQSPDGTTEELFNCTAALQTRCQANTLSYDDERDVFLYSLFSVDSVLEISGSNGALNKRFGQVPASWTFDPPQSEFWYQHGPTYTPEGNLLLSTHRSENDYELVVREYELDEQSRTLREVWSFGEGEDVIGTQMGESHRLQGGNTLHNHGTHAVVREVSPAGEVVWDLRWETSEYRSRDGHTVGRSQPVYGADLYRFLPDR